MPEEKLVFTPSRGYNINLSIGNKKYSNDLKSVRIVSSINTAYQIVILDLSLDSNDTILTDKSGNTPFAKLPIKLSIKLIGMKEPNIPTEDVQMTLQYASSDAPIPPKKQQSEGHTKDRVNISILCVCSKPFATMSKIINLVSIEKTPKEIVEDLVSKTDAKLEYDSEGQNNTKIEQAILPPTALYNQIRYLDDTFGLFLGASNLAFCQYDNTIYIQNLTNRIKKNQVFTVYQLATDDKETKTIIEKCSDGKNFYCTSPPISKYEGSATLAILAKKVNFIIKPKDELYTYKKDLLPNIMKNYGLIAGKGNIDIPVDPYQNILKDSIILRKR